VEGSKGVSTVGLFSMLQGFAAIIVGLGLLYNIKIEVRSIGWLIQIISAFYLIQGIFAIIYGYGLLKLQKWAWFLAFYTVTISMIIHIPLAFAGGLGFPGMVIFYILRTYLKKVEEYY
jgi:hypothetical protein